MSETTFHTHTEPQAKFRRNKVENKEKLNKRQKEWGRERMRNKHNIMKR
jgi:hypothetical protein